MRSVAVIGPNGQLGFDLVKRFSQSGWNVTSVDHEMLSVEDSSSAARFFADNRVDAIVNTAAFHQVAICEDEVARSWEVNATGPRNLAEIARSIGATSVFISTDYVFDGCIADTSSYPEDSAVSPVNVYGASKAAGEVATMAASERNLVVRIASVFGSAGSSGKGGNFVETIARKARAGDQLKVVGDVYMSPSYTVDVASKIEGLLSAGATGTFHACNAGRITWHEFAQEICGQLGIPVAVEKTASDFSSLPRRPRNSSMSTERIDALNIPQRSWRAALAAYLREKNHIS